MDNATILFKYMNIWESQNLSHFQQFRKISSHGIEISCSVFNTSEKLRTKINFTEHHWLLCHSQIHHFRTSKIVSEPVLHCHKNYPFIIRTSHLDNGHIWRSISRTNEFFKVLISRNEFGEPRDSLMAYSLIECYCV